MKVPLLDLQAQDAVVGKEVRAAMERVLQSQHFILGPEVEALEKEVAAYSQCKHGIGVSSGTDALLISLMAAGVGPGDEVVTTPFTFIATAMCVARLGAKAVFVDIEPKFFNLDVSRVEKAITSRTRAVLPVHLYGQMAETAPLAALCKARGVVLIEDAAQAIGSEENGRRAGSLGQLGCLSFFPSKNLGGAGDGGMVVSNDDVLAARVRLMRNQGQSPKYFAKAVGGNFRLDALQAAVVRAKLPHLDGWTKARQENAARYRRLFAEAGLTEKLVLPEERPGCRHIYNQFVVRTSARDALQKWLNEHQVGNEVYYPLSMHQQEAFATWGYKPGDFPLSEAAAKQSVAIPIYPELTSAMQERVVSVVKDFFARN
jgi:dTDP-4-amino-4,6-dideoxygalactose transaminase